MGQLYKNFFKISYLFRNFNRTIFLTATKKKPFTKSETVDHNNKIEIDYKIVARLEKISLVGFNNDNGLRKLEAAIRFSQKLKELPLDSSVEPMFSVLENKKLQLREDKVTDDDYRDKILKNAKLLEDEYIIAPPGNTPKDL